MWHNTDRKSCMSLLSSDYPTKSLIQEESDFSTDWLEHVATRWQTCLISPPPLPSVPSCSTSSKCLHFWVVEVFASQASTMDLAAGLVWLFHNIFVVFIKLSPYTLKTNLFCCAHQLNIFAKMERITFNATVLTICFSLWKAFEPTMDSMLDNLSKNVSDQACSFTLPACFFSNSSSTCMHLNNPFSTNGTLVLNFVGVTQHLGSGSKAR